MTAPAGRHRLVRPGCQPAASLLSMLHIYVMLYNNHSWGSAVAKRKYGSGLTENPRRSAVLASAKGEGLLDGVSGRIAGRIRKGLIGAAKTRSGIKSDTDLLEYALARVALEDDFGKRLVAREGRVPQDIDLEF
jgi:hypothetical protein